jgi:ketosteroid isomerase-like protein
LGCIVFLEVWERNMPMGKWTLMIALGLAASAGALLAQGNAPMEVQKALQADYNDRDSAVAHKDIDGTLAHYAPDFTSLASTGKAHDLAKERADFLKTFSLPAKSSVIKSTIQKVTVGKAGTEVMVTVKRHGILLFANAQTQLNDVLVLVGVYQDTWAKRSGGWLLTREQESSRKATMNGKPF